MAAKRELTFLGLVQNVAVVVAGAVLELLVVVVDAFADGVRSAEVERCALNFQNLSVGMLVLLMGRKKSALSWHSTFMTLGVGSASPAKEKNP